MELLAFFFVQTLIDVLKGGLAGDLLEEIDEVGLRLIVPLAFVPFRFVGIRHELYRKHGLGEPHMPYNPE